MQPGMLHASSLDSLLAQAQAQSSAQKPTMGMGAMGGGSVKLSASAGSFADAIAGKDAVTAVNQFCQRFSGKLLGKEDIVYTCVKLAEGHQCTLKLDCLDEHPEFAGEVCSNAKDAKLSAAQQVLQMYAHEIATMPAATSKNKKKRPATSQGGPAAQVARTDGVNEPLPPNQSNKGDLNTTYSKIIRRPTVKNEIIFNTSNVVGGFQSQVQLPGLPPPWNNELWAGEVHAKKADAEQSVAGVALATIRGDASLMAAFNRPPKPNQWLLNGGMDRLKGGKGKGKGKDGGKGGGMPQVGGVGGWDAGGGVSAISATGGQDWMQAMMYSNAINAMSGSGFSPALQ